MKREDEFSIARRERLEALRFIARNPIWHCEACGQEVKLKTNGKVRNHFTVSLTPAGETPTLCTGSHRLPAEATSRLARRSSCQECGSTMVTWSLVALQCESSPVLHGRLTMKDVEAALVLGCDECSATVSIVRDRDLDELKTIEFTDDHETMMKKLGR